MKYLSNSLKNQYIRYLTPLSIISYICLQIKLVTSHAHIKYKKKIEQVVQNFLINIYSETLKTPIRNFLIFKIYKTFSKINEFLFILYHKIDTIMS